MSIRVSVADLEAISQLSSARHITKWQHFISNDKDYYIYGREPIDVDFLQISLREIKQFISELPDGSTRYVLTHVYRAGYLTGQQYVYLYGRSQYQYCKEVVAQ